MNKYYQIPCKCGKILEIQKSQAGAMLHCECGESFEAPSLRHLESFPIVERSEPSEGEKKENLSLTQETGVRQRRLGWLVFLLAAAALSAYGSYYYYTTRPVIPKIQDMELIDTWYTWQELRPGIAAPQSRFEEMRTYQIQTCWRWVFFYGTLSILSLLGSLSILFLRAGTKSKKRSLISRPEKFGGTAGE